METSRHFLGVQATRVRCMGASQGGTTAALGYVDADLALNCVGFLTLYPDADTNEDSVRWRSSWTCNGAVTALDADAPGDLGSIGRAPAIWAGTARGDVIRIAVASGNADDDGSDGVARGRAHAGIVSGITVNATSGEVATVGKDGVMLHGAREGRVVSETFAAGSATGGSSITWATMDTFVTSARSAGLRVWDRRVAHKAALTFPTPGGLGDTLGLSVCSHRPHIVATAHASPGGLACLDVRGTTRPQIWNLDGPGHAWDVRFAPPAWASAGEPRGLLAILEEEGPGGTLGVSRGDAIECLAHEAGGLRSFDVSREGGDEATVVAATRHEGLVVWRGLGRGQQPS